jgi:F-type H+-transporting ATPase subunit b
VNFNLTLIGQTVAFIVFVWFTMKFVWPLLIGMMEAREKRIADGLDAAEKGQQKFEQAEQRFRELVDEGKQKAAEIIAQAGKRRDEIVEAAKGEARVEAGRILDGARGEIDQERQLARQQLREQVAALALAGAEQVLMREVDRKTHDDVLGKMSARL